MSSPTGTNQASEVKRNSLNKSDIDVKLDKALGYMTIVWDESSVFGQPPDYSHIHLTGKQEAKQAILDWHNKQVEEVLDRLDLSMRGKTIVDTAEGWQRFVKRHVQGAIEAERNKLNPSKSTPFNKLEESSND